MLNEPAERPDDSSGSRTWVRLCQARRAVRRGRQANTSASDKQTALSVVLSTSNRDYDKCTVMMYDKCVVRCIYEYWLTKVQVPGAPFATSGGTAFSYNINSSFVMMAFICSRSSSRTYSSNTKVLVVLLKTTVQKYIYSYNQTYKANGEKVPQGKRPLCNYLLWPPVRTSLAYCFTQEFST